MKRGRNKRKKPLIEWNEKDQPTEFTRIEYEKNLAALIESLKKEVPGIIISSHN